MAKILVIDDDRELLDTLSDGLRADGMEVATRDTIDGAIAAIASERPDALVLDVMFPENPSGGFDLAREIRKTRGIEHLPIILLSAINQEFPTDFSRDDIDEQWFPVEDMMDKPVDMKKLRARLTELLPAT